MFVCFGKDSVAYIHPKGAALRTSKRESPLWVAIATVLSQSVLLWRRLSRPCPLASVLSVVLSPKVRPLLPAGQCKSWELCFFGPIGGRFAAHGPPPVIHLTWLESTRFDCVTNWSYRWVTTTLPSSSLAVLILQLRLGAASFPSYHLSLNPFHHTHYRLRLMNDHLSIIITNCALPYQCVLIEYSL